MEDLMSILSRVSGPWLFIIGLSVVLGCRSRLGGPCKTKDDCGLGLYCDLDKEVCDDRGKLLKKQAEEIYVYPIPARQPKSSKGAAPGVLPVP